MPVNCALVLNVEVTDDGLVLQASYDEAMIEHNRVYLMLRQFEHLYRQLCVPSPDATADTLDFCCAEDAADLAKLNGNVPEPTMSCVHDLIAQQVTTRPGNEAVCAWDGSMNYQEFDWATAKLASHLHHDLQLSPGSVVPYCFDKSLWSIVSIVAILRAGCGVTALDPMWPRERISHVLVETQSVAILCDDAALAKFGGMHPLMLAVNARLLDGLSHDRELPISDPSSLLFLQLTSGSTGKPKLIEMHHHSFASSIAGHAPRLCITANSRVLQFCNFTYDVSMGEVLTTLAVVCNALKHILQAKSLSDI